MISISTTKSNGIAEAITGLSLADTSIKRVFFQSLGRSVSRAKNMVAKEIAIELKLPIKTIRRRLLMFQQKSSSSQDIKIWAGLNDIPIGYLGKAKQLDDDVLVKGVKVNNAYISNGLVVLRETKEIATLTIEQKVRDILIQRFPYYFNREFEKTFGQLLRYKFNK